MAGPTARLLAVLELLQTHGRITGAELARRLGVDGRTVRRYVVTLEEMGVPVATERGRDGAYLLVAGFKLPPMMFTEDEALVLSVGLLAVRSLGLADAAPAVSSAQAKLERVMPTALKKRVRAVDDTIALDFSRREQITPRDNSALTQLMAAAQRQTQVRLSYLAASGAKTERTFDPYGLGHRGGRWYVVGMCHLRGGVRSFRLDRVVTVQPGELSFERPPRFNVLEYLATSIASLPRAHAIEVLLKTTLQKARHELFPAAGVLELTPDGVVLRSQADDLNWFARELSRLPFTFEIWKPVALAGALASHARSLLQLLPLPV